MKKSLLALSLGTFALGISEFVMMGILSTLSADLDISITDTGHLISAYAAGVCLGAPALLFARRVALKRIMLVLAAIIAAGNLLATLAPGFATLLAARFISGLPHGAYFGVGAIVARRLATPGKEATAVSIMLGGMSVATLMGVPAATWITEQFTWRLAFATVALAGVATFVSIRLLVPQVKPLPDMGFKGQFHFLSKPAPWLIFGGVLFGQIGLYSWYSYIDPQMVNNVGFTTADLSWIMVLAGAGMFMGNLIAGQLADRFKPSIVSCCIFLVGAAVLLAFSILFSHKAIAILLMITATAVLFGSGTPLQTSIVGYSRGGEMVGAASIQIAYNGANAIAAWLGGWVIAAGHPYTFTALMGIPPVLVGAALLLVLYLKVERRRG